jgi:hypothetical protein
MDETTRPNIITIGIIANSLSILLAWVWNALGPIPLGAVEQGALSLLLTAGAQYWDRTSKRANDHVLTKYGPTEVSK